MAERSVLVVEDEENLLEALRYNLEREGYLVHTATDGGEGLEMARKLKPSLVLLDIMLPTLDGFEICRILRRESEVPILILTAKGEEVDRVVGLGTGRRRLHNQALQHSGTGGAGTQRPAPNQAPGQGTRPAAYDRAELTASAPWK